MSSVIDSTLGSGSGVEVLFSLTVRQHLHRYFHPSLLPSWLNSNLHTGNESRNGIHTTPPNIDLFTSLFFPLYLQSDPTITTRSMSVSGSYLWLGNDAMC